MRKTIAALASLAACLVLSIAASAQITTSSISGTVTEGPDAPLEGAVIIAVHTPTGTQYYGVANEFGQYQIHNVRSGGPYTVTVSFLGMADARYDGIILSLGDDYQLDATLQASNELDEVVVVGQSNFNATKKGAGSGFSAAQLEAMPTIDRSVFDVVRYTPQVAKSKTGGITIAGASSRYNSFQIDGAVANDAFGLSSDGTNGAMTGANPISYDAIEEIQVSVAPFDVRQSGFTGGAINAITKSGTNQVKGTFYGTYFDQNFIGTTPGTTDWNDEYALSSLQKVSDGNGGYLAEALRTKYDEELTYTAGFTVGAPIIKNKLFIFLSGEYHNVSQPNIYSPVNGSYLSESRKFTKPITLPDGSVHEYLDEAVAQAAIDHYKNVFSNGGLDAEGNPVNDGYALQQAHKKSLNVMARIDWNISDKHKLMFRYQLLDSSSENLGQGVKTYYFNNSNNTIVNRTNTLVAELHSRFSDIVSNSFSVTAVLVDEHREVPYAGPGIYTNGDNTVLDMGTHYCSYINKTMVNTYTLTDNLTIALGKHTLTLGTHNELYRFANAYRTYATGQYNFSSAADFFATGDDTFAQAMANAYPESYACGKYFNTFQYNYADPTVEGVTGPDWYAKTNALQLGFYAQDEWKPSRDFTLTYGIRADIPMFLNKPTANEEYNANAATYSVDASEQVGTVPNTTILWSPRVGFRWCTNDDHSTVVRGGVGLFTGRIPFVWISNAYNNTGVETKGVKVTDAALLQSIPITTDPYNDVVKAGIVSGSNAGATINTLSSNFKYPQVLRANLGIDQEIEGGWKIGFDALFNKGFNNVYFRNIALESNATTYAAGAGAAASALPYYHARTSSYSTIIALGNTNKGYGYSFSLKADKHFDFGLNIMTSYTYGHSYSANDGLSSQAASNLSTLKAVDVNAPELSYSLYDVPFKANVIAAYVTPVYAGRFRTIMTLTYTGQSGQRYSYTYKEASTSVDLNGDNLTGNTLMYIPTTAEVAQMNFSEAADAAKLESAIRADKYLSSHRGQFSERNGGIGKFEHHFDLQIAEDIYYDKANKRKLQVTADFLNISNLFNRNWGLYYASSIYRTLLEVDSITTDGSGNKIPTYSFYDDNAIYLSDFYSRWRCQVGLKLTF